MNARIRSRRPSRRRSQFQGPSVAQRILGRFKAMRSKWKDAQRRKNDRSAAKQNLSMEKSDVVERPSSGLRPKASPFRAIMGVGVPLAAASFTYAAARNGQFPPNMPTEAAGVLIYAALGTCLYASGKIMARTRRAMLGLAGFTLAGAALGGGIAMHDSDTECLTELNRRIKAGEALPAILRCPITPSVVFPDPAPR